jgi:predicted ABC-type ATPase
VPPDRVLSRYPRTVRHLGVAVRRADLSLLYDTSHPPGEPVQPPRLVARLRAGDVRWQADDLPAWAQRVLAPDPTLR